MGCCGSTPPPIPKEKPVESNSVLNGPRPKPEEPEKEKPKVDNKPAPIQPVATSSPSEINPPPEPEPEPAPIIDIIPDPTPEKKEEKQEEKERVSNLLVQPPDPSPQLLQVDGFYSPTSRKSIVKQGKRRSEIRAQIREFRQQWKESQAMEELEAEDDLYSNKTGEDALKVFQSLFEVDSVWTGIAEWESDGTSLGLEFTVLSAPDEEGRFSVSRLYHVARGRSRQVDNVRAYEETVIIDRTYTEQLVFEYKEETPEGLELLLECRARHDHNKIHLKRTYVQGIAKKRKLEDTDGKYEEGRFDFVRTYYKQAGKFIRHNSLDFDDAASSRENSREDSAVHVTQRMARYSEQFSREVTTGRSSGLPDMGSIKKGNTSGRTITALLSTEEILEAQEEASESRSHTFY